MTENYCVRWEGVIVPPTTGEYTFSAGGDDGVRLWIDGKQVMEDWGVHAYREFTTEPMRLEAGKAISVKLDFFQGGGESKCMLKWNVPAKEEIDAQKLLTRAAQDGTTLFFVDRPETWLVEIKKQTTLKTNGFFEIGMNWVGGQFFTKKHPLLEGLPTDCAMNWPYQRVVRKGISRMALKLEGEELVAGAYQTETPERKMELGTAIGVVPCGKGKIVLSTLDICGALDDADSTAEVARKMLCNYIRFATTAKSEKSEK